MYSCRAVQPYLVAFPCDSEGNGRRVDGSVPLSLLLDVKKLVQRIRAIASKRLPDQFVSYSFLLFKHRQHIAGGVFKPRDRRAPASGNPLFVLVAFKVDLQTHATRGQVFFYLALFERLFALAFTARAIPSPEVGQSDAVGAGRDRDRQTHAHGG